MKLNFPYRIHIIQPKNAPDNCISGDMILLIMNITNWRKIQDNKQNIMDKNKRIEREKLIECDNKVDYFVLVYDNQARICNEIFKVPYNIT